MPKRKPWAEIKIISLLINQVYREHKHNIFWHFGQRKKVVGLSKQRKCFDHRGLVMSKTPEFSGVIVESTEKLWAEENSVNILITNV